MEPLGKATVTSTSFAAPWIARKMAYLMHVMGLSREVAKALIIDSAAGGIGKIRLSMKKDTAIFYQQRWISISEELWSRKVKL